MLRKPLGRGSVLEHQEGEDVFYVNQAGLLMVRTYSKCFLLVVVMPIRFMLHYYYMQ